MAERELNTINIFKNFFAGGVAGMMSKSAVAPLDRLQILFQAGHQEHMGHGILTGFQHILKREGFRAFYKGNLAHMVQIFPYAAVKYSTFELYKQNLETVFGAKSHVDKLFAGAGAGMSAVTVTYPLDTIRAKLAFQINREQRYSGILHAAKFIFKNEGGLRALYRGFMPAMIGIVPNAGITFYCFEYLKFASIKYMPIYTCTNDPSNSVQNLTVAIKFICGGIAGGIGQTIFYPLDVTRRRMQLAMMNPKAAKFGKSMFQTIAFIIREHGIKGLYRGGL